MDESRWRTGDKVRDLAQPRVVRIIGRLNVGGPARQACYLHDALAGSFETHLIVGRIADGEEDMSYLLSNHRNVHTVTAMSREVRFGADLRAAIQMYRILRRLRPDIVHTHTAKAGTLGRVMAWLARVPIRIHTFHGNVFDGYFGGSKAGFFRWIERCLGRISTRIVAISPSQSEDLTGKYRVADKQKVVVIRNGFEWREHKADPSREEALKRVGIVDPQCFVVVWAARMVPIKNVPLLRRVVEACSNNPNIRFLVVGDGPEKECLAGLLERGPNMKLLGWRRDMDVIWAAADVALLTSLNEGTPTSLVEAMIASKPFISTDVGGVRDLIDGELVSLDGMRVGANGILVAPAADAISRAIHYLADDSGRRQLMGVAAKRFVAEKYNADRLQSELTGLYQALLNGQVELGEQARLKASRNTAYGR